MDSNVYDGWSKWKERPFVAIVILIVYCQLFLPITLDELLKHITDFIIKFVLNPKWREILHASFIDVEVHLQIIDAAMMAFYIFFQNQKALVKLVMIMKVRKGPAYL